MDDVVRYYNLACAITVALVGLPQLRGFLTRGGKDQLHWQSSILWNVTVIWGTYESLRAGYPGGLRIYLTAASVTWLLAAVAYKPVTRWRATHPRHPDREEP